MPDRIVNYDGSITTSPKQLIYPETVEQIQSVLRDPARFPKSGPRYGKLPFPDAPCASSDGTIVNMSRMIRIIDIDHANRTFTAEAGLQFIEASKALREHDLQFMTNIEIGNVTLGAGACCHTKDALDGIEFGQVSSYVTTIGGSRPPATSPKRPKPAVPTCRAWSGRATAYVASSMRSHSV